MDYTGQVEMIVFKNSFKRLVKYALRPGVNFVNARPKLILFATSVANKIGLEGVTRSVCSRLMIRAYGQMSNLNNFIPKDAKSLSPRARMIYADIKAAIEHRKRGSL